MGSLERRGWVAGGVEDYVAEIAGWTSAAGSDAVEARILELSAENRRIHEAQCVNLNPATNVMNPRAEALLASGLGTRPSLGYPGDKYEMGLEAIEKIEVIAAELAAEIFGAKYAEIRVSSGAMANLYAFMATCQPGDAIIAPPSSIGGHVTHHAAGAAGLYGLKIHEAPVTADYAPDLDGLAALARTVRPKLITLGASLNLFPWDVAAARKVADEVGAWLLFDAAHLCGMIAGGTFPNPLAEGAHLMTMSTYKSLGGPAGGLLVTNEARLAQKLDAIAFPGLTANFDVAKSAALAVALLDWREYGADYARAMVATSTALAQALQARGLPVFTTSLGATSSHQFALKAAGFGGGQTASKRLRSSNILACGIGLPIAPVDDDLNGLRIGTPEIVRFGMGPADMDELADLITRSLTGNDPEALAPAVTAFRARFATLHFMR
ncbi:serine hydroxymethyltransferase [Chachezhania sediminis]|uniref:serine hydroxymethyltransferase n=1 Tax=Chachezhania sediminis TaxID=2599291 RepID=UPI00131C8D52|nr:aminotransferase class I/II-fold pyridoxal phosphate-dependent enzyme [Chachezhania sediminis]